MNWWCLTLPDIELCLPIWEVLYYYLGLKSQSSAAATTYWDWTKLTWHDTCWQEGSGGSIKCEWNVLDEVLHFPYDEHTHTHTETQHVSLWLRNQRHTFVFTRVHIVHPFFLHASIRTYLSHITDNLAGDVMEMIYSYTWCRLHTHTRIILWWSCARCDCCTVIVHV